MMPHCRRFLGVNSVTNIEPGGGFLPVPIIRNEYWFEKFCVHHLSDSATFLPAISNRRKGHGKRLECAGFPIYEHSGYAA